MINSLDLKEYLARKREYADVELLSELAVEAVEKSEEQKEVIDRLLIEVDVYKRLIKEMCLNKLREEAIKEPLIKGSLDDYLDSMGEN